MAEPVGPWRVLLFRFLARAWVFRLSLSGTGEPVLLGVRRGQLGDCSFGD